MLGDTILAQASTPGAAERAVLRLSGPAARAAAELVFRPGLPPRRCQLDGELQLRGRGVEALALVMPGPRSFTGEDVVELHLPGSPLLVATLTEDLLRRGEALGLRAALPGEFTARACSNGRLDLAQAEGILMLLHAADRRAVLASAQWLRGGMSAAIAGLRAGLQDVLALLESGLDFGDDETGAVPAGEIERPLAAIDERLAELLGSLPGAAAGGEVLLLGAANAGKSSLCNALAGEAAVLVDAVPGTTRDLVRVEIGDGLALWDAPGDLAAPSQWDAAALQLRDRLAGRAASALLVLDAGAPVWPAPGGRDALPWLAVVVTKCDLLSAPFVLPARLAVDLPADLPLLQTCALDGRGLPELRDLLGRAARAGVSDAGGPLRAALGAVAAAVARARTILAAGAELAAVELQAALRALDGIDGSHTPEALLDRIYGRFCLGK